MALTRDQKEAQLQEFQKKFQEAQSVMFTHYTGLSVAEVSELRAALKEEDAELKVGKKTLMKLAAQKADLPELDEEVLEGPVGCIFSFSDPLKGAQTAHKFSKDHPQVEFVGGIFDGELLNKAQAVALAKMPSREELLATFVGKICAPLQQFASMSASPLSQFARALSERAKQQEA